MNNKKVLFFSTALISISILTYYFLTTDNSIPTNENVVIAATDEPASDSNSEAALTSNASLSSKVSTKKPLDEIALQTIEQSLGDSPEQQAQQKAAAFFSSNAFHSDENISASYVNKDGSVSRSAIEMSFANDDFSQLVTALKSAERDSTSFELESKLSEHLYKTIKSGIYEEKYSCAGSVCALTFKAAKSEDEFDLIKDFSSSYSFINVTQDDQGSIVYKAVYIQTENPSNLVIQ